MLCATIAEGCFVGVNSCVRQGRYIPAEREEGGGEGGGGCVCVSLSQITSGALIRARGVSRPFDIQMTI